VPPGRLRLGADSLVIVTVPKIRQLTDVSHCKLHQHLCCNRKIGSSLTGSPGLAAQSEPCRPDRLPQPGKETQMDTMALTRPAAPRKLRLTLATGQAAVAVARCEVRAAIRAWNVPVDSAVAVRLTSQLVTNALGREAGKTIELVISCALGQLQVDVYDTSPAVALPGGAPAGLEAGREVMLLASLSGSWGYYRTPTSEARYFTLMF